MLGFWKYVQLYRVSYKSHKNLLAMGMLSSFPHNSNNVCSEKQEEEEEEEEEYIRVLRTPYLQMLQRGR